MLRINALFIFLLSLTTFAFAEGPYEAIGTVDKYDSLRGVIVLDGSSYKLIGQANANLLISIREAKLDTLVGKEISYQIDIHGNGRTIRDVHVPIDDE